MKKKKVNKKEYYYWVIVNVNRIKKLIIIFYMCIFEYSRGEISVDTESSFSYEHLKALFRP